MERRHGGILPTKVRGLGTLTDEFEKLGRLSESVVCEWETSPGKGNAARGEVIVATSAGDGGAAEFWTEVEDDYGSFVVVTAAAIGVPRERRRSVWER
mmetsp:Transcript_11782/g.25088  ORF Transcript_11782/g.25088 Transcript_11782/m.25088 type:complete len:98 (-) Transcript_11782:387-680(-)